VERRVVSRAQIARVPCLPCGGLFGLPIPSVTITVNELDPARSLLEYRCEVGHLTRRPLPGAVGSRAQVTFVRRWEFLGARVERVTETTLNDACFEFRRWLGEDGPTGFDASRARQKLADLRRGDDAGERS
jgi:hypothetical protein